MDYNMILNLLYFPLFLINIETSSNFNDKSNFKEAVYHVLKDEGGLSTNKSDKGGITKYGISINYIKCLVKKNPNLINSFDLNGNKKIDSYDIINLTKNEAENIYKKYWWEEFGYGKINYQPLANKIFDLSINIGPQKASLILQMAIQKTTGQKGFKCKEILNDAIINYVNALSDDKKYLIIKNIRYFQIKYYYEIVKKNPSQKKFIKGWLKRAEK